MVNPILANKEIADAVSAVTTPRPVPTPPKAPLTVAKKEATLPKKKDKKRWEPRPHLTARLGSYFPAELVAYATTAR